MLSTKHLVTLALLGSASILSAQIDLHWKGRTIQIHSFASQGFAYSGSNNYLTMKTRDGSFAMTDGGANVTSQITDNFRVGAQLYIRNIGNLGNFRPQIDWAYGDYKFASWLGLRAGKVKSALGLYNDTQDLEFLHTWALLPQSTYPVDLRASTIAHVGGDLYGGIPVKHLGTFSYTAYAGVRQDDPQGGYRYGLTAAAFENAHTSGHQIGADLRWNTTIPGLTLGASLMNAPGGAAATRRIAPQMVWNVGLTSSDRILAYYAEYKHERLTLAGEYRREILKGSSAVGALPAIPFHMDSRAWWGSAAYRVSKRLELGTYHSRFYPEQSVAYKADPANHVFDWTVAARVDVNNHWDIKLEQHFMDGFANPTSFRGFYPQDNTAGLKPQTNMFVVRTGWNF